jgi:Holliday junction resolvase RusA-like endonuclease
MITEYRVRLSKLNQKRDLYVGRTRPAIEEQLRKQGRKGTNSFRYDVFIWIVEGKKRPAADVDNYAKRTIDSITKTRLLWKDDRQIDSLVVRRRRELRRPSTQIAIRARQTKGQHTGMPTFFSALCETAKAGGSSSYSDVGYQLARHLQDQPPDDLDQCEWAERIGGLYQLLENKEYESVWNWLCEHLAFVRRVPTERRRQLVAGVNQAYEEGYIEGDWGGEAL